MGLLEGLKKAVSTAGAQITSSSPKPKGIYFTNNFQLKAKQRDSPKKMRSMFFITAKKTNQAGKSESTMAANCIFTMDRVRPLHSRISQQYGSGKDDKSADELTTCHSTATHMVQSLKASPSTGSANSITNAAPLSE